MTSSIPVAATRMEQGSGPQAVLLDLDGTLVDTEGIWWAAEAQVFADLGHVLDDAHRSVVVGGPMTRSVGHLMQVTGTTGHPRRADAGHQQPVPGADRPRRAADAGRPPAASPSWPRTACPPPCLRSHRTTIDAMLRSLGREHFAFTLARRRGDPHQAAPRAVSDRGRPARRPPGGLRGGRGHPDRSPRPRRRPAAGWWPFPRWCRSSPRLAEPSSAPWRS